MLVYILLFLNFRLKFDSCRTFSEFVSQSVFISFFVISLHFLVDEIQAACYKILDSAYLMNILASTTSQRKSIAYEIDK